MLSVPIMLSRPSLRPVSTPRAVARGGGWGRCGGGCPRRSCGPCLRCWSPRGVLSLTRRAGVVCRSSLVGFSSVSLYAPPLVRAPFVVAAVPRGGGGGPSLLSLSSPLLSSPLTVAVVSLCPVPGLPGRGCPPPPLSRSSLVTPPSPGCYLTMLLLPPPLVLLPLRRRPLPSFSSSSSSWWRHSRSFPVAPAVRGVSAVVERRRRRRGGRGTFLGVSIIEIPKIQ